ncbi:hypothetical protein SynPROS71_01718 [Synechococcus sp. PROS-7-1]|nr:hypothetical protein SynPROS71_01718 [Synechococcus sp. PROS-7-1]
MWGDQGVSWISTLLLAAACFVCKRIENPANWMGFECLLGDG